MVPASLLWLLGERTDFLVVILDLGHFGCIRKEKWYADGPLTTCPSFTHSLAHSLTLSLSLSLSLCFSLSLVNCQGSLFGTFGLTMNNDVQPLDLWPRGARN